MTTMTSPCGKFSYQEVATAAKECRIILFKGTQKIATIDNACRYYNGFFSKDGHVWFFTGRNLSTNTFVNCSTREVIEHKSSPTSDSFSWLSAKVSQNGRILAAQGCKWGLPYGPYEIRFYDFSNPSAGFPEIDLNFDKIPQDKMPSNSCPFFVAQNTEWYWEDDNFIFVENVKYDTVLKKVIDGYVRESRVEDQVTKVWFTATAKPQVDEQGKLSLVVDSIVNDPDLPPI